MATRETPSADEGRLIAALEQSLVLVEKQTLNLPLSRWNLKHSIEAWSVAEIVHHLILVEVQRLQQLKDLLEGKRESAAARTDSAPPDFAGVRARMKPVKTTKDMEPTPEIPPKVLIAGLRRARSETIAFVRASDLQQLEKVWINTVSLGALNGVEFIEFLSAHMERHARQIAETLQQS
ncbi:MAG: DinB family protein [candidate division KSB1 bacterium]|nr:DinB family protein [candidate division KSB1 bacterium]MDZ7275437.1 DinB family protein [candidate division KSB1 bacterium]MDZ7286250.1 DinB family protein [candidate division KSB1 bacterium]MDZ7296476.1 DinB family protein [candidate division KSB1 bacterium]MDZ7305565.1 DinB family protein [candidate division KSB1 bacterium]